MLTDTISQCASANTAEEGACIRDREEVEGQVRVEPYEHAAEGDVCQALYVMIIASSVERVRSSFHYTSISQRLTV